MTSDRFYRTTPRHFLHNITINFYKMVNTVNFKHGFFFILSIFLSGCENKSANDLETMAQGQHSAENALEEVLEIPLAQARVLEPESEMAQVEKFRNEFADLINKHKTDKEIYTLELEVILENEKAAEEIGKESLDEADQISLDGMKAQIQANLPLKKLLQEILVALDRVDYQIQKVAYQKIIVDIKSPQKEKKSSAINAILKFFKDKPKTLTEAIGELSLLKNKLPAIRKQNEEEKARIKADTIAKLDKLPKPLHEIDADKAETFRSELADLINKNKMDKKAFTLELEEILELEKTTEQLEKKKMDQVGSISLDGMKARIKANSELKQLLLDILSVLVQVDNEIQKVAYKNIYVDLKSPQKSKEKSAAIDSILKFFQGEPKSLSEAKERLSSLKDKLPALRQKTEKAREKIRNETIAKLDKLPKSA